MTVNIIASGKFHYLYYAQYLYAKGMLEKLYFSHKLSSGRFLPPHARKNLFLKEYLLGAHLRVFGERMIHGGLDAYNALWDIQLSKCFRPAPKNLFLLHGNCCRTFKQFGGDAMFIGEVVNSHPFETHKRLVDAAADIGLSVPRQQWAASRIVNELDYVEYILCPSMAVKKSFVSHGFNSEKCVVIPYGVERIPFESGRKKHPPFGTGTVVAARPRMVVVGQVTLRKGHHLLLQRLSSFAKRNQAPIPKLTFIGRVEADYLIALRKLGVDFECLGHMSRRQLLLALRQFDLLCMPSIEDGFGMAAMEAAAAGLAVLVSIYAGVSELVGSHLSGASFDPFSDTCFDEAYFKALKMTGVPSKSPPDWRCYADALSSLLERI